MANGHNHLLWQLAIERFGYDLANMPKSWPILVGTAAYHWPAKLKELQALGVDLTVALTRGQTVPQITALSSMPAAEWLSLAKQLHKKCPSILERADQDRAKTVDWLCAYGTREAVDWVLQTAHPRASLTKPMYTALLFAVHGGNMAALTALLKHTGGSGTGAFKKRDVQQCMETCQLLVAPDMENLLHRLFPSLTPDAESDAMLNSLHAHTCRPTLFQSLVTYRSMHRLDDWLNRSSANEKAADPDTLTELTRRYAETQAYFYGLQRGLTELDLEQWRHRLPLHFRALPEGNGVMGGPRKGWSFDEAVTAADGSGLDQDGLAQPEMTPQCAPS